VVACAEDGHHSVTTLTFGVPFNTGFLNASTFRRIRLLEALLTMALAIGLLVAPAAQHRILFRAPE
jgi:hypothetical protein